MWQLAHLSRHCCLLGGLAKPKLEEGTTQAVVQVAAPTVFGAVTVVGVVMVAGVPMEVQVGTTTAREEVYTTARVEVQEVAMGRMGRREDMRTTATVAMARVVVQVEALTMRPQHRRLIMALRLAHLRLAHLRLARRRRTAT